MNQNQLRTTKEEIVNKVAELFSDIGNKQDTSKIKSYLTSLQHLGVLSQLTPSQIFHFLRIAFDLKLDPLKKEIYCIPRNGRNGDSIQITIAYQEYIKRAAQHPNYQVPNVTTFCEGDMKGWYCEVEARRKGDDIPIKRRFYMREWNQGTPTWNAKPIFMLEKTAIKNTLAWMYPELNDFTRVEETTINTDGELGYIGDEVEQKTSSLKVPQEVLASVEKRVGIKKPKEPILEEVEDEQV